ncbi:hypothetical protein LCGC14_3025960, partial [marine sediment metagenome]
ARRLDFRTTKDTRVVRVFRAQSAPSPGMTITWHSGKQVPKPPVVLYVHYSERFSDEQLREALDELLDPPAGVETLMAVERMFDRGQRKRLYGLLERSKRPTAASLIRLAEHYQADGDHNAAKRTAARVRTLMWLDRQSSKLKGRFDKLAKKLGVAKGSEDAPSAEALRAVGVVEVAPGSPPAEVTVALNERAAFLLTDAEGEPVVLMYRVIDAGGQTRSPYALKCQTRRQGMWSWETQGGKVGPDGRWSADHNAHTRSRVTRCRVQSADKPGRFKVSLWRSRPAATSSAGPSP